MPDAVRKSYVQQQLPVRKQSLAAFGQNRSSSRQKANGNIPVRRVGSSIITSSIVNRYNHQQQIKQQKQQQQLLQRSMTSIVNTNSTAYNEEIKEEQVIKEEEEEEEDNNSLNNKTMTPSSSMEKDLVYTPTLSPASSYHSLPNNDISENRFFTTTSSSIENNSIHSRNSSNSNCNSMNSTLNTTINKKDDIEDDDNFNFGNRPPSTINCTQPILPTTPTGNSNNNISPRSSSFLHPINTTNLSLSSVSPLSAPAQGASSPSLLSSSSPSPNEKTSSILLSSLDTQPPYIGFNHHHPYQNDHNNNHNNDDDDDNSTVFSPSTPIVFDPSTANSTPTDSHWPAPVPSLSESLNGDRERSYWRKGSVGDLSSAVPSSTNKKQHQKNQSSVDNALMDDLKQQQEKQQKSIYKYFASASLVSLSSSLPNKISSSSSSEQQQSSSVTLSLKRNDSLSSFISTSSSSNVYIALFSQIALEFYKKISLKTLTKDDIEYHHAFSGKDAVDCLIMILRTKDRNLGLLIGRAIGLQQFFHDVTYEHHLRDSREKLYQFKDNISGSLSQSSDDLINEDRSKSKSFENGIDKNELPNGVFTLLTDCYSPTCKRDQGCYSIHCPRKGKSITRSQSQSSLQEKEEERKLWIHSVPKSIVDATPREEMKRQECIYELIHTEADFVEDLKYVHNFWVKPLITQDIIPDERREHFVQEVFWNMADIEKVNGTLSQALTTLQKENHLVPSIGEVLMSHVAKFDPFVAYGAHQIIGKFKFELEKKRNPSFAQFVQTTERLPESRRLELNGYLTKPTTRLGRYNLLLREILKRTPEDNPDYLMIPKVMDIITSYLVQVNSETGKCENIFNLQQLEERMSFKTSTVQVDLELRNPQRQLIMQGRMNRKENTASESSELQVLLFDHYLVIAKIKYHDHLEYYKVNRQPIPLELLTITTSSNQRAKRASTILAYRSSTIQPAATQLSLTRASTVDNLLGNAGNNASSINLNGNSKSGGAGITFYHHGHKGSPPITLYVSSLQARRSWVEQIQKQQDLLKKKRSIFAIRPLVHRQFLTSNRVQDTIVMKKRFKQESSFSESRESLPLDNSYDNDSYTMIVGTDMGIYVGTVKSNQRKYKEIDDGDDDDESSTNFSDDFDDFDDDMQCSTMQRVISLDKVSHIELMEGSQLLVLAEKTLWTFPLDEVLEPSMDNNKPMTIKKGRSISTNTSFFYVGECMGKSLVCVVKPNTLGTTTIRVMEPIVTDDNKNKKSGFSIRRLVRNGPVGLKPYKDLYLPSEALSINLLKSKMCISCPREIGVVDMKSFGVQTLLDPEDEELAFVYSRQDIRPITIYRVQFAEYLVCYDAFGFFVDQRGRWIRSSRILEWEGTPTSFALSYPYVIAFEPGFIEVRNLLTGKIDQLIRGINMRCTNIREGVIQGSMNDPDNDGYQVIFELDRIKP
ncbi:unnamed protein product [Cunninghamella blakesleeana]